MPILGPTPSNGSGNTLFPSKFRSVASIPKGQYDVYVTHGPLYLANHVDEDVYDEVHINEFGVESERFRASVSSIDASIGKTIEFPGYFSADFGLATAYHEQGLNNPIDTVTFAESEDLDVLFFIDSNKITDTITFLGGKSGLLGHFLEKSDNVEAKDLYDYLVPALAYSTRSVATEAFPYGKGQFAVLGMTSEERIDNPPLLFEDPATFYDDARSAFPSSLIMLQTPRGPLDSDSSFFSAIAAMLNLPEGQPLEPDNHYFTMGTGSGTGTTWLDFDLLQILEGNDYSGYLKTRGDWFALLNAGIFKPITGGSEVGSTANLCVGAVRTFVAVTNDVHRDNDLIEFWENVKAGRMFVTNGPLIEASVNGSGFGQTTTGQSLNALQLKVQAAPWIPVDSIRVFVDGTLYSTLEATGVGNIQFEGEVDVTLTTGKHWIVIEAGTQLETYVPGSSAGTFSQVYRNHTPIAITNPIFVDVN